MVHPDVPNFQLLRQPIPVSLTKKDLKGELERAISSTYFHQNLGTCTYVGVTSIFLQPLNPAI